MISDFFLFSHALVKLLLCKVINGHLSLPILQFVLNNNQLNIFYVRPGADLFSNSEYVM